MSSFSSSLGMRGLRWVLLLAVLAVSYFMRDGREARPAGEPRERPEAVVEIVEQAETVRPQAPLSKNEWPVWTSTRELTGQENAEAHWRKHRREFPEYRSAQEYIEGAHRFLRGPPEGTLFKSRPNGDRLFFNPETGTFAVQARNGAPRTMFRPKNGLHYWNRQ